MDDWGGERVVVMGSDDDEQAYNGRGLLCCFWFLEIDVFLSK